MGAKRKTIAGALPLIDGQRSSRKPRSILKDKGQPRSWTLSSHAASILDEMPAFFIKDVKCSSNASTAFSICGM
jgi:hypothetical protein